MKTEDQLRADIRLAEDVLRKLRADLELAQAVGVNNKLAAQLDQLALCLRRGTARIVHREFCASRATGYDTEYTVQITEQISSELFSVRAIR